MAHYTLGFHMQYYHSVWLKQVDRSCGDAQCTDCTVQTEASFARRMSAMARVSFAVLSFGAALATEETAASLRGSAAARRLGSCTADATPCAAPHSNSASQLPAAIPAAVPAEHLGWRLLEGRTRSRNV